MLCVQVLRRSFGADYDTILQYYTALSAVFWQTDLLSCFGTYCCVQGGDIVHVLLAMLVTSVFFFWFVVSAIVHENAYELLVTVVLSAVIAVRTVYYVVRLPGS